MTPEYFVELRSILRRMTYDMYAASYWPTEQQIRYERKKDEANGKDRSWDEVVRDLKFAHADLMTGRV